MTERKRDSDREKRERGTERREKEGQRQRERGTETERKRDKEIEGQRQRERGTERKEGKRGFRERLISTLFVNDQNVKVKLFKFYIEIPARYIQHFYNG